MSKITVIEVLALPEDRLLVRGTAEGHTQTVDKPVFDKDGKQKFEGRGRNRRPVVKSVKEPVVFEARGWRSALQNHYDESSIGEDGHRKDDAEPREMTGAERLGYCRSLLEEVIEAQPKPLPISG